MKKIGIIAAMEEEKDAVKKIMTDINQINIHGINYIEGKINGRECVLAESGIGKVNAARTTQILLDKFDIEYVVNVGSAASANDELKIGDMVVGEELVQHDFDITAFGHKKGYISNVGDTILSDKNLVMKFKDTVSEIEDNSFKIKIGNIASGDIFCTDVNMKNKIYKKFNADAIEMEGAAIAQVCYLDKVPFVIVRSISDSPNGENNITFEEYLKLASERCANLLKKFI